MKAFRVAALGVALVIGAAAAASAQGAPPAPQQQGAPGMGLRRPNPLMDGIELTDTQKMKLEVINKKYQPEREALRESMRNGGDRAEMMQKMRTLQEKVQPEIRAVLTAEQQAVFDKHGAELKANMEARQHQAPPSI